ncbi:Uncharacterised protein [Shewanella morhuae]|uniref:Uncharacterized protein n=1 Tax=Shewanella morhuae TaxID=365591 RepID=A0A379ZTG6_9GAMM|nr:Uncharacterised protein [Shewanella morhuae]
MRFCEKAGNYRWTKKSSMLVGEMLQVDRNLSCELLGLY